MKTTHPEPLHAVYYWKRRPNIWLEIPQDLSLRRPAWQTLSKALHVSSATARVPLDLLQTLAILSDTTVRSAVDREDLKPYCKSEKRPHFSSWSTILLFTSFSKTLLLTTNYRKKTNRVVVFSFRPFPDNFKYREHRWNLPTIWKTRHLHTYWRAQLVFSKVQAHSSLEPPLESGPSESGLEKSTTFLTISVTEILCSFRLVLDGKTRKETPESWNTSGPLNRGHIEDLPLLRSLLAIHQKS